MRKIKLFFVFIRWCWEYPLEIGENWSTIKTRYRIETDPEIQKLLKEIEDEL